MISSLNILTFLIVSSSSYLWISRQNSIFKLLEKSFSLEGNRYKNLVKVNIVRLKIISDGFTQARCMTRNQKV